MKKFFKQHIEQSLALAALLFLGIIVIYYLWGITTISLAVSQVVDVSIPSSTATVFNVNGAESLNLKGLISQ